MLEMQVERESEPKKREQLPVIDGDIHIAMASDEVLYRYLPARWRRYHEAFGLRRRYGGAYPRAMPNAARHDAWPPSGQIPGSDLGFLQEQLLDEWNIEYGILNPLLGAGGVLDLEFGAAFARAINDWQLAEWVEPEPRLKASIVVAYEDGDLAAAEIDRLGDHPGFVQVLLLVRTLEPLGRRKYWKMYEAAARHDLPIGIHFGGSGAGPITGGGWPSHYIEDHAGMPQSFQAQLISMVCEGIFEHFPTLRVVLIEGGFAWLPPLTWRLDASWNKLKEYAPDLRRAPSEYIKEHIWLTTQPMEEPSQRKFFYQLLAQMDADERLMFATDYPHWDFDAPDRAFPVELEPELKRKILAENARKFYGL